MRIRLVIKDSEYCKALMKALQRYNQDLFVESGGDFECNSESLIVTDFNIKYFDMRIVEKKRGGVVFILPREVPEKLKIREVGPFFIFKYDGMERIMASLNLAYSLWQGDEQIKNTGCKIVSVFSDGGGKSTYISKLLSRQTVYRLGLKTLIIPMTFVSNLPSGTVDTGTFMKLMYYIDSRRKLSRAVYFEKDNYDVEYLRMPIGINPFVALSEEKLREIFHFFSANYFDLIILDIGTAYTDTAIKFIKESDFLVWVQSSSSDVILKEAAKSRSEEVFKVDWEYGIDHAALAADDLITHIYGKSMA